MPSKIINYIILYVNNKKKDVIYDAQTFDLSSITEEQLKKSKQIAAYIVNDLVERYLDDQIECKCWPDQCRDISEFIFDKDLGSIINVKGTRSNFLGLYKNAVCVIANLCKTHETFEISNNEDNCLAYNNFLKIVGPFPFIRDYIYSSYELRNKEIIIKVNSDYVHLEESQCMFSNPYGEWLDDIENKNQKLDNKNYIKRYKIK
jgi:hypothetical protein